MAWQENSEKLICSSIEFIYIYLDILWSSIEREATQELEALDRLCRQLEDWRNETESELTVSLRVSDKMRKEKKAVAEEKRQIVSVTTYVV